MWSAKRTYGVLAMVLGLALLLLTACGGDEDEAATAAPTAKATTAATAPAAGTQAASPAATSAATQPAQSGDTRLKVSAEELAMMSPKMQDVIKKWHPNNLKAPDPYKPTSGGIVQHNINFGPPASYDPTKPHTLATDNHHTALAGYLFTWSQNWGDELIIVTPKAQLAEKWDLSGDSKNWTIKIRQGVKFRNVPPINGREVTADDVKFSLDTYFTNSFLKSEFPDIERVEKIDNYTVRIVGNRPIPNLLKGFVSPKMPIFNKECYDTPDCMAKNWQAAFVPGPFVLEKAETGVATVFKRNPDFWLTDPKSGQQLPYVDELRGITLADPAQQIATVRTGQIDATWLTTLFDFESVNKTNPNLTVMYETGGNQWWNADISMFWQMNQPPFNDPRVRRAVSMGIDRDAICAGIFGGVCALTYSFPQYFEFGKTYSPTSTKQLSPASRYDTKEAKRLLSEAGLANGFSFKAVRPASPPADAQGLAIEKTWLVVQEQLKQIGVNMEFDRVADMAPINAKFYNAAEALDRNIPMLTRSCGTRADWCLYSQINSKGNSNYARVNDPEIDRLTAELVSLPSESKERVAVALKIEEWFDKNQPWLNISDIPRFVVTQPWLINLGSMQDTAPIVFNVGFHRVWIDCEKAKQANMPAERRPSACK